MKHGASYQITELLDVFCKGDIHLSLKEQGAVERRAFSKTFEQSAEALDMHLVYDVSHNIAKVEQHAMSNEWMIVVATDDDVSSAVVVWCRRHHNS